MVSNYLMQINWLSDFQRREEYTKNRLHATVTAVQISNGNVTYYAEQGSFREYLRQ